MKVKVTDLRSIGRYSDRLETVVTVNVGDWMDRKSVEWLRLGAASLQRIENHRRPNSWYLSAHLGSGPDAGVEGMATDFEHDSAYACRMPLIGLELEMVRDHSLFAAAWVDPDALDDFKVPLPGYNPLAHPKAFVCEAKRCIEGSEGEKHIIVPEGHYMPETNPELYELVRGKRVEIYMRPVYPGEQE